MENNIFDQEKRYGAHNYEPLPVVLVKGRGVYVWDDKGTQYLDMMSAYSAVSHGHCHPKLIQALRKQSEKLNVVSRAFYSDQLASFLKYACELTGFEQALPMNSGAEAVETALKAARKWAYTVKKIPPHTAEIIACQNNFHGRTIAIVGMSTEASYRNGFDPFPSGFKTIPFGDPEALSQAITPHTAAFLVEPVQGEGGIIVPPAGYLHACSEICKKHNVLLICDEIQTGLGRTGKLLAVNHDDIKPDGVILGKALGGGILPVSLFLTRKNIMDVFTPGDHGSTFGGNPLAAAVGKVALQVLIEEKLIENAANLGAYFLTLLKAIKSPLIKDIRGKGLMIGIEVHADYSARDVCLNLLHNGLLSKETHHTVIRLAPPLVITKDQIESAVSIITRTLHQMSH